MIHEDMNDLIISLSRESIFYYCSTLDYPKNYVVETRNPYLISNIVAVLIKYFPYSGQSFFIERIEMRDQILHIDFTLDEKECKVSFTMRT